MQVFLVDDMSCGHCAAAITESILAIDAGAVVDVSLREHRVTVTGHAAGHTFAHPGHQGRRLCIGPCFIPGGTSRSTSSGRLLLRFDRLSMRHLRRVKGLLTDW
ncbi:MAG TPA: heavy-metal-associated domain-containing protein [Roseateles sp.]